MRYYGKIKVFVLLVLMGSCTLKAPKHDFDGFTGRWSLFIVETKLDSASQWLPRQDHYKNRNGFIIYDGKGGMGVHHVIEDYEKYQFEGKGSIDSLSITDLRHLANNFVYFGKYKVIDSLSIIEHHIESASMPAMWGKIMKRKYDFSGDTLILYPVTEKYPKTRLKWIRQNDLKE